jgi:surface antigen
MLKRPVTLLMAATVLAGSAVPAFAQRANRDYEDGYRAGYERGYTDGRRAALDERDRYVPPSPPPAAAPGGVSDRDLRWRQRYQRTYSYRDDPYYTECRTQPDPAGVIAGALIGGLLGNAIGRGGGRTGASIAGVVLGGVVGGALTRNLSCEDRSYAYRTYYDGFNAGRPGARYQWRNPGNGHYGDFEVGQYYNDPDNFRCATFTQQIYIDGRPQAASGRACQQPDGTWAVVG